MVVHIELDLDKVVGFDPKSALIDSSWPNQWLNCIQLKLVQRMNFEKDEQLQGTLNHLWEEAKEVSFRQFS